MLIDRLIRFHPGELSLRLVDNRTQRPAGLGTDCGNGMLSGVRRLDDDR